MVIPENIEIDTEAETATIPLDRYKQLRVAEKRYNWILEEVRECGIDYLDTTYIKLGWPSHLSLDDSIDKSLKEKGEQKL